MPPKNAPQETFPLLQLPLLAQIEVLKHMKPTELMLFSFLSKRAKLAVEASKRKMGDLVWKFNGHADTYIYINTRNEDMITSHFLSIGDQLKELLEHRETISLNGLHLSLAGFRGVWYFIAANPSDVMSLADVVSKHLLDVFRFSQFEFYGCDLTIDPKDLFVWKYTKTFASVDVWGTISDNFMKFALDNLTMKQFSVFSKPDGNIQYSGPLKMETLVTRDWQWLTLDALLNMECKRVIIDNDIGTVDIDMNRLLKYWQSGKGLRNLEEIEIEKLSNPNCLEGIETFPSNIDTWPKEEQWRPETDAYEDILRNDGMRAGVFSDGDGFLHFFRLGT